MLRATSARPPDAGARRQLRPRRDDRHRHRPGRAPHLDPGRRRSPGSPGVLLVSATGGLSPNTGFFILLPLFAAVVLGGIGNAFGALAGGMVIGLAQEWSTLVISPEWKVAVSFIVLILVLLVRPEGIFGKERTL